MHNKKWLTNKLLFHQFSVGLMISLIDWVCMSGWPVQAILKWRPTKGFFIAWFPPNIMRLTICTFPAIENWNLWHCFFVVLLFPCQFLVALAALYLTLVSESVSECYFWILTQRATFNTWDPQTFDQDKKAKRQKDKKTHRQKDAQTKKKDKRRF